MHANGQRGDAKELVKASKPPPIPFLSDKELEELRAKFYDEPTHQDLGDIFAEGIANGTLRIDEDEDDMDYPEQPDDTFALNFFGKSIEQFSLFFFTHFVLQGGESPLRQHHSPATRPRASTRSKTRSRRLKKIQTMRLSPS